VGGGGRVWGGLRVAIHGLTAMSRSRLIAIPFRPKILRCGVHGKEIEWRDERLRRDRQAAIRQPPSLTIIRDTHRVTTREIQLRFSLSTYASSGLSTQVALKDASIRPLQVRQVLADASGGPGPLTGWGESAPQVARALSSLHLLYSKVQSRPADMEATHREELHSKASSAADDAPKAPKSASQ
jgi:hypothetical protein